MNTSTDILPSATDVLIVGAGPTGMALAICLQQAGVSHVIVDKLPHGLNTSRAGVIHAHTLEVLDRLGVSQELVRRGLIIQNFTLRERDRALLSIDFQDLPSRHHYILMLPQNETEDVLTRKLSALGGTIHRGIAVTSVSQTAETCTTTLETGNGSTTIRARYVVGGDGLHSIVRESAGIEFEGGSYAESFILADVRMDWAFAANEVSLFFSPAGLVVVAPLPNNIYRVVATVDEAPEVPSLEFVQTLMDQRGPTGGRNRITGIEWSSRFRLQHRLAKSYRSGRLLLMGDAAHVHSPAGGQGMNTGLVDSVVLGELLAKVVQFEAPDTALDIYQTLRRPAAAKVLKLAGLLTNLAVMRGRVRQFLRNVALSVVNRLPPARRRLRMNLSGLSRAELSVVSGVAPAEAKSTVQAA